MADLEQAGLELVAENADSFESEIRSANNAAESFGSGMESVSSGIDAAGEIITGALRAVGEIAVTSLLAAGSAVVDFLGDSFAGALEAEETMARLGQVIESTGEAAGVSVSDAEALADQFKNLAGGSDDAIISIIDMGLRMGTVSEEMMPSFIQSTLDLGAVMGDSGKAAQVMSRAIEDPVGTLGALRKAGILVNEETEAQIKAMVAAGDTAGAYSLLMDRVGTATAGAAETMAMTTAGQWAIFQETLADAGETIVGAFLPAIMSIATPILEDVIPAISTMAGALGTLFSSLLSGDGSDAFTVLIENFGLTVEQANAVFNVIDALKLGFETFVGFIQSNLPLLQSTFTTVWTAVQGVLQVISDFVAVTLMPAIATIWEQTGIQLPTMQQTFEGVMAGITVAAQMIADFITNTLVPAFTAAVNWVVANWPNIQATIQTVWDTIQIALNAAVEFFNTTLVPAFQTVVDWVITNWPTIQTNIETVFNAIQSIINTVISEVVPFVVEKFTEIKAWVDTNWPLIQATIETVINAINSVITTVVTAITAFWEEHFTTIQTVAQTIWDNIKLNIENTIALIEGIIKTTMQLITGDWEGAWNTIKDTANTIWTNIQTQIDNTVNAISTVVQDVIGTLKTWWDTKWTEIKTSVATIIGDILTNITGKITEIQNAFTSIDWLGIGTSIIDGVKNGVSNAIGGLVSTAAQAALDAYNAARQALGIGSPSKLFMEIGVNTQKSMALGVEKTKDVPAIASANAAMMMAPPASAFMTGGTRVSSPPVYTPTRTPGDTSMPGGSPVSISIDARGASPSETERAVTRATRIAGQYSDTRLRMRGAM